MIRRKKIRAAPKKYTFSFLFANAVNLNKFILFYFFYKCKYMFKYAFVEKTKLNKFVQVRLNKFVQKRREKIRSILNRREKIWSILKRRENIELATLWEINFRLLDYLDNIRVFACLTHESRTMFFFVCARTTPVIIARKMSKIIFIDSLVNCHISMCYFWLG